MAVPRTANAVPKRKKLPRGSRNAPATGPIRIGELADFVGYSLKRAQLRIFDDFSRSAAALQLTPAQFSVLMLVDANPGRNQTKIAATLGILRPNFVVLLDNLEKRGLCLRARSKSDRRSHVLTLTEKGRGVLARARKLIRARHEARLSALLGEENRRLLLTVLGKIAREF